MKKDFLFSKELEASLINLIKKVLDNKETTVIIRNEVNQYLDSHGLINVIRDQVKREVSSIFQRKDLMILQKKKND